MPTPTRTIYCCEGCGATATENGFPLDNRCACEDEQPTLAPIVPAPLDATVLDPVEQMPNEYAKRVKARLAADVAYLTLQAERGHGEAAPAVCERYGHDARSGLCMRCGGRLGRRDDE